MTRPTTSALVLDGSDVKLRLTAERVSTGSVVHVDWLRFTVIRRNAPFLPADMAFPRADLNVWDEDYRAAQLARVLRTIPDGDFDAAAQAMDLAQTVAGALGPEFSVFPEVRKGHDFYKFRWSIERCGTECGWVGFLSSGDSPRQQAQSRTLHANIWGSACTFAAEGWTYRLASVVRQCDGDITRCDLALDFFDGLPGGLDGVVADYKSGACNVGGRKLKCNMVGDWANGHERSFYFGSKEAGKQTNVYEKGDQLFGVEAGSLWHRIELRYGNKLRVLPVEILLNPADFFAGASDWHALALSKAAEAVSAQKVPVIARLKLQTVEAEVTRNLRHALVNAAPTIAAAWDFLGDAFLELVTNKKLPGRLQKFPRVELRPAFAAAMSRLSSVGGGLPDSLLTVH